ncbi:hypothetical protein [Thiolapillus brandeum]|uniref:hypothetical protein n=1 Tax=Thiolapillus brandeum TaxID=1076588 RepID=UPI000597D8F9|nr:hypothetical protein [Thiolapillus brandeum]
MNYSSYLMREQAHDVVSSLDRATRHQKQQLRVRRLRSLIEISAFIAAVASYMVALSLVA